MFAVIFERQDRKPDEIYYYNKRVDAVYHFGLFFNDNTDMYSKISIIDVDENREIMYNTLNSDAVK